MGAARRLLETITGPVVAPVGAGNQANNAELSSRANFDTNMVIILAALLCALICALGLNSLVRCFLRCTHHHHRLGGMEERRLSATGLKKSALRKIPILVYGSGSGSDPPPEMCVDLGGECAICLGEFMEGDKLRLLPNCNHGFHVTCIDTWLRSHSSCPNCRHSLLECGPPRPTT